MVPLQSWYVPANGTIATGTTPHAAALLNTVCAKRRHMHYSGQPGATQPALLRDHCCTWYTLGYPGTRAGLFGRTYTGISPGYLQASRIYPAEYTLYSKLFFAC